MAKKKKKPKKLKAGGVSKGTTTTKSKGKSPNLVKKLFQPRALSTFAFGTSGLLAGLATGLNHFPNSQDLPVIPKMIALAAYLGDPHLDVAAGMATGFTGLVVGACLGFSALSDPKDMGISVLLSSVFAFTAYTLTGDMTLAGLGFLAGHSPAIMAYLKLRRA